MKKEKITITTFPKGILIKIWWFFRDKSFRKDIFNLHFRPKIFEKDIDDIIYNNVTRKKAKKK